MAFSKEEALSLLQKAAANDHLAHAYLISGGSEKARDTLAQDFAAEILQTHLLGLPHHPDFFQVEPDSRARKIVTEQIRSLEEKLHLTAQEGNYQVVVIENAERMVPAAANAFLKTLEEPPDQTLLLLLSSLPEALLPTIRSRCVPITLKEELVEELSQEQQELKVLLNRHFEEEQATSSGISTAFLGDAFQMAHATLELIKAIRARTLAEAEEQFALEKKEYAQTTDGSWESGRHQQLKVAAEAAALRERTLLLETLQHYFGKQLRMILESEPKNFVDARKCSLQKKRLLQQLDAIEKMGLALERGVQEQLALEVGFLNLFSLSSLKI